MENPILFSQDYPLSILIAENNPDARTATKNILAGLGYQPEVAASREEVVHMTTTGSYDVILMDIHMPEVECMVADPLRGRENKRPLIIAMTGTTPDFRQICLQSEMDHSIRKPVDPGELRLQLKAWSVLTGNCRVRPL